MATTTIVGDTNCSFANIVKVLRQEETFYYSTNNWADIAKNLDLPDDDVEWMKNIHSVLANHILKRLLERFQATYGEEATLDKLISVLEAEGLTELGNCLQKSFHLNQFATTDGNKPERPPPPEKPPRLSLPRVEVNDVDPAERQRRKRGKQKKLVGNLMLGMTVVKTVVSAGQFLSKHK